MTYRLAEPNEGLTRHLILTLTIIVVFVVADERAFGLYQALGIEVDWTTIKDRLFLVHSWQMIPPLIVALIFFGSGAFRALGLQANILTGLRSDLSAPCLCCSDMRFSARLAQAKRRSTSS
ncbi:hypothetical protein [Parvularcula marina]|uniref:Uncharacterized protein n=1 Tax=Parvularcula marina TaxID=2292771 RepID=A0A371RHL8_9PROT|nr:hypothetical protein [Parvularcula marina]RFB04958.1 hypothetical protein DX908_06455 [Parvularcula marina]